MKVAELVKVQKLHVQPEETKKVSAELNYVLVVARFQVPYGKYFTSLSNFAPCLKSLKASEIKTKFEKSLKHLPILHKANERLINSLSIALVPYSTFLRRKLCIKNVSCWKASGNSKFQTALCVDN